MGRGGRRRGGCGFSSRGYIISLRGSFVFCFFAFLSFALMHNRVSARIVIRRSASVPPPRSFAPSFIRPLMWCHPVSCQPRREQGGGPPWATRAMRVTGRRQMKERCRRLHEAVKVRKIWMQSTAALADLGIPSGGTAECSRRFRDDLCELCGRGQREAFPVLLPKPSSPPSCRTCAHVAVGFLKTTHEFTIKRAERLKLALAKWLKQRPGKIYRPPSPNPSPDQVPHGRIFTARIQPKQTRETRRVDASGAPNHRCAPPPAFETEEPTETTAKDQFNS